MRDHHTSAGAGQALDSDAIRRRIFEVVGGPECPGGDSEHILVLVALAEYLPTPAPSVPTLSTMTGLSVRTVLRRTQDLEKWGLLQGEHDRTGRRPTRWQFGGPLLAPSSHLGRRDALAPKRRYLAANRKNRPARNFEKTAARAYKMFAAHRPEGLRRELDNGLADIVVMPHEGLRIADDVLEGRLHAWPKEWPIVEAVASRLAAPMEPANVATPGDAARPKYASFSADDTRDEEDEPEAA